MNVVLAESYHKLQCEFITAKTLALRVLGRKLDLETSLKDHKQVSQMLCIMDTLLCPKICFLNTNLPLK